MRELLDRINRGDIGPDDVHEELDSIAKEKARNALDSGKVKSDRLTPYLDKEREKLLKNEQVLSSEAYSHAGQGRNPSSFPTSAGAALKFGLGHGALNYGAAKLVGAPMSVSHALLHPVLPSATALSTIFDAGSLATNPLHDPEYKMGRRGYFSSFKEGLKGDINSFDNKQKEIREKYGLLGLPLQTLHGIMHPVTGISYGLSGLKDAILGKEGSHIASRAETAIDRALYSEG
jgi:hypothetical protein